MTEVFPNVFMEQVPLTGSPLKELNCFIIKGEKRSLVVDVGYDIPEGREKIKAALRELACDPETTDLFITHVHEDHIGAMLSLKAEGCFHNVYCGEQEAHFYNQIRFRGLRQQVIRQAAWEGFSKEEGEQAFLNHPAHGLTGGLLPVPFVTVREGDIIDIGDFALQVFIFPGHTMGLSALYEREKKLLFAGDHILGKITPNITFWRLDFDALGAYMHSLERADKLDVAHLFSAHRALVPDMHARIHELLTHHERRMEDALNMLRTYGRLTVCQTAAGMHWDYAGGDFKKFALTQKWFATGEAFAHLEHLYYEGILLREGEDGTFYYSVR